MEITKIKEFEKVVTVLKQAKVPAKVMLVDSFGKGDFEINVITGWNTPDEIDEKIFDAFEENNIDSSDISIMGDLSLSNSCIKVKVSNAYGYKRSW